MGAARTVFVWNMDEAPFIKLEFWEMTHRLASYIHRDIYNMGAWHK